MPTVDLRLHSPCSSERGYTDHFEYDPNTEVQTLQVRPGTKSMPVQLKPSPNIPSTSGTTASLVSKIRKQAKELSDLHAELASKEKLIQKLQNSRLHGNVSNGVKIKPVDGNESEWKVKFQKEQKKYEMCLKKLREVKASLDEKDEEKKRIIHHSKQFDNAMSELRNKMESNSSGTEEERTYIRLLEEAVQLKAAEFNVVGQAELMLVLAELRQTIQTQQDKLSQKDSVILDLQLAVAAKATVSVDDGNKTKLSEVDALSKQKEAMIEYAQTLSDRQRSADTQNSELAGELNKLRCMYEQATLELKTLNDRNTQVERDITRFNAEKQGLNGRISELEGSIIEKDSQMSSMRQEYDRNLRQFNEMKALQEELLNEISDAKEKERKWKKKLDIAEEDIKQLTNKSKEYQQEITILTDKQKQIEMSNAAAKAHVEGLTQSLHRTHIEKEQMKSEYRQMQEYESSFSDIKRHRKTFAALQESERTIRADLNMLDSVFATSTIAQTRMQFHPHAKHQTSNEEDDTSSFVEWFIVSDVVSRVAMLDQRRMPHQLAQRMPRFATYLHELFESVTAMTKHVSEVDTSWKRERFNLVAARDAFEASATLIQNELEMMRQWSFQLHDDLQESNRALIDLEQRCKSTTMQAGDASNQVQDLQQRLATTYQTMRELQENEEQVQQCIAAKDEALRSAQQRNLLLTNQIEELQEAQEKSIHELSQEREANEHAKSQIESQLHEIQDHVHQLSIKENALNQMRVELQEYNSLVNEYDELKSKLVNLEFEATMTADEKRRQLDLIQSHMTLIEEAAWDVFMHVQPLLPKSMQTKTGDIQIALRELPQMIDKLVEFQVRTHAHESMKEALLQNCQNTEFQDPSLCLLRELKADLQQLADENQALRAQLSDSRSNILAQACHMSCNPVDDQTNETMKPHSAQVNFISPRNAQVVESLRKKMKQKIPENSKAEKQSGKISADEYVKSVKSATIEDQLEKLHAAFASFRTDI